MALDRIVASVALGVLMFLGVMVSNNDRASAHHYWIPPIHIDSIHNNTTDAESLCAWSQDPAFNQSALLIRVAQGLWLDSPGYEWEGVASNKIDFLHTQTTCTSMPSAVRATYEIEYTVRANTQSICGGSGTGVSCTGLDQWVYNSAVGHGDYAKSYVTFKTAHLNGSAALYHHTVNHETGHVLGMCDPTQSGCSSGGCPGSVMHSAYYGCTNLEFPSAGDIWVMTTIANDSVPDQ